MPIRSKGGGATTVETPHTYSVETETSARGEQSIKITLGFPTRMPASSENTGLRPTTIGTSFYKIDDFEDYSNETELWVPGDWSIDANGLGKYYYPYLDISNYNALSFYAKTEYPVSIQFSVRSPNGIWTEKFPIYLTAKHWKRYDALIRPSSSNAQPVSASDICFEFRGIAETNVWLDELYFVDLRTASEKTTWISMNVHGEEIQHQSEMVVGDTAGRRGDIVYGTYADNRRGTIAFRTHAPQDEEDIYFVECVKGNGDMCYLRNLGEGWPIYIDSINVGIGDTYFGSQRKIRMSFIEDTLE